MALEDDLSLLFSHASYILVYAELCIQLQNLQIARNK